MSEAPPTKSVGEEGGNQASNTQEAGNIEDKIMVIEEATSKDAINATLSDLKPFAEKRLDGAITDAKKQMEKKQQDADVGSKKRGRPSKKAAEVAAATLADQPQTAAKDFPSIVFKADGEDAGGKLQLASELQVDEPAIIRAIPSRSRSST